jgi:hypothetical protein
LVNADRVGENDRPGNSAASRAAWVIQKANGLIRAHRHRLIFDVENAAVLEILYLGYATHVFADAVACTVM